MPHTKLDFYYLEDGAPRDFCKIAPEEITRLLAKCDVFLQGIEDAYRPISQRVADAVRACMTQLPKSTVGFIRDADRRTAHDAVCGLLSFLDPTIKSLTPLVLALERPEAALSRASAYTDDDALRAALQERQKRINELRNRIHTFDRSQLAPFIVRLGSASDLEHLGISASPQTILTLCGAFLNLL